MSIFLIGVGLWFAILGGIVYRLWKRPGPTVEERYQRLVDEKFGKKTPMEKQPDI